MDNEMRHLRHVAREYGLSERQCKDLHTLFETKGEHAALAEARRLLGREEAAPTFDYERDLPADAEPTTTRDVLTTTYRRRTEQSVEPTADLHTFLLDHPEHLPALLRAGTVDHDYAHRHFRKSRKTGNWRPRKRLRPEAPMAATRAREAVNAPEPVDPGGLVLHDIGLPASVILPPPYNPPAPQRERLDLFEWYKGDFDPPALYRIKDTAEGGASGLEAHELIPHTLQVAS